jgi:hypothetical protein
MMVCWKFRSGIKATASKCHQILALSKFELLLMNSTRPSLTLRVSRAVVSIVCVDPNGAQHTDVKCGREEGQRIVCWGDSRRVQLNPVTCRRNQDVVIWSHDCSRYDLGDLGIQCPTV